MADKIRTAFGEKPKLGVYLLEYVFTKETKEHGLDWEPIDLDLGTLAIVIDPRTHLSIRLSGNGDVEVMVHASGMRESLAFLPGASNVGKLRVIERA